MGASVGVKPHRLLEATFHPGIVTKHIAAADEVGT